MYVIHKDVIIHKYVLAKLFICVKIYLMGLSGQKRFNSRFIKQRLFNQSQIITFKIRNL